jgi:hypothetical protein
MKIIIRLQGKFLHPAFFEILLLKKCTSSSNVWQQSGGRYGFLLKSKDQWNKDD